MRDIEDRIMWHRDCVEMLEKKLAIARQALEQLESLERNVGNKLPGFRNQYVAKTALAQINGENGK